MCFFKLLQFQIRQYLTYQAWFHKSLTFTFYWPNPTLSTFRQNPMYHWRRKLSVNSRKLLDSCWQNGSMGRYHPIWHCYIDPNSALGPLLGTLLCKWLLHPWLLLLAVLWTRLLYWPLLSTGWRGAWASLIRGQLQQRLTYPRLKGHNH